MVKSMSVEDQEEIVVMPTRLATAASLALDPRTPDQYDELGEGEEDMLSDTELMGERYDPTPLEPMLLRPGHWR